ncbi:hypothetical protein PtA15_12A24 [Puccinia triticina]|uniref:Uncharacterized protein n=1 Tax=Puccinia triticina TaxID=208348 RepID=A0ABY7CZK7_9BASI|nr:uncharacterized protein PtA15_12A24 [Puccinia triticina]WAQ90039.1 hypothetical protein PtA15_12A24 [Puccinia triticina]
MENVPAEFLVFTETVGINQTLIWSSALFDFLYSEAFRLHERHGNRPSALFLKLGACPA